MSSEQENIVVTEETQGHNAGKIIIGGIGTTAVAAVGAVFSLRWAGMFSMPALYGTGAVLGLAAAAGVGLTVFGATRHCGFWQSSPTDATETSQLTRADVTDRSDSSVSFSLTPEQQIRRLL